MQLIERIELWYRKRRMCFDESQCQSFYESFLEDRDWIVIQNDIGPYLIRKPIQDYLKDARGQVIVDVGCGTGAYVSALNFQKNFVYGCDLAMASLRKAKRLNTTNICFFQDSIYELPFKDNKLDTVICLDVLEHLEDDKRALDEIFRVLSKSGYLIVRVPNRRWSERHKEAYGHLRHYTQEGLRDLLAKSGFVIVRTFHMYPWFTDLNRYFYAFVTALNILYSKTKGDNRTFYDRKIGQYAFYERLCFPILLEMSKLDEKLTEKSGLRRSTFVMAKKMGRPVL